MDITSIIVVGICVIGLVGGIIYEHSGTKSK